MKPADEKTISPSTKVGELLDSYPDLEPILFELSPAFSKLRNPVLRKTVARVTTLQQAAKVGGVSLATMINRLRSAAGLDPTDLPENTAGEESAGPPPWYSSDRIIGELDVRRLLEAGDKPMGRVLAALDHTREGDIYQITAPFLPAPLIDVAKKRSFDVWWIQEGAELFQVYFCRQALSTGTEPTLVELA